MDIFEFKSYKMYLTQYIHSQPRGEASQIATSLKIHNTTLSQVLRGSKNINQEQGISLANYLEFNDKESNYLLMLINYERAGTQNLRLFYEKQLKTISEEVKNQFNFKTTQSNSDLTMDEKVRFYSSWIYSACRIISSIPECNSLDSISSRLNLPRTKTKEILDFLVNSGLCIKSDDEYKPGPAHTHISSSDPSIYQHRLNWRLKAIEKAGSFENHELSFSAPMSLSKSDMIKIRVELNKIIKQTIETAIDSKPEIAVCLNIDLFEF